jgi:hypothetical protein
MDFSGLMHIWRLGLKHLHGARGIPLVSQYPCSSLNELARTDGNGVFPVSQPVDQRHVKRSRIFY